MNILNVHFFNGFSHCALYCTGGRQPLKWACFLRNKNKAIQNQTQLRMLITLVIKVLCTGFKSFICSSFFSSFFLPHLVFPLVGDSKGGRRNLRNATSPWQAVIPPPWANVLSLKMLQAHYRSIRVHILEDYFPAGLIASDILKLCHYHREKPGSPNIIRSLYV